ncbi:unnamed protein product [Peniophora sp. CBMAI 1063]|nr:unnamed protein product [Peniophora sp. CBMAI 1063]
MFGLKTSTLMFFIWTWTTAAAASSNLTIPSSWQGTTSNVSRSSREAFAHDAATTLLGHVNPSIQSSDLPWSDWITDAFAVLALQDYYSGNSSWNNVVADGLQTYYRQYGLYWKGPRLNSDAIYWGLAFFYAYRTYKQQPLLDLAIAAYNATYTNAFITAEAAASGTGAGRNVSLTPPVGCTNRETLQVSYVTSADSLPDSTYGGVFWMVDVKNDTTINSETISPFMALSGYLYEETQDSIYAQAAQASLDFILNFLWNGTVVHDSFTLSSCALQQTEFLTYNQAWFIEGLSVWANVTKNDTLTELLGEVIPIVTTYPAWSSSDGVISEASQTVANHNALTDHDVIYKGILIRGLSEARLRNPGTDLSRYIEAYVTVQFNSILDNALYVASNNSFYSTSWYGPAEQTFSAVGNMAALDVLNTAFNFVSPTTPSGATSPRESTTSSVSPTASVATNRHHEVSVVVGSVVGSAIAALVFIGSFLVWRRHRHHRADDVLDPRADFNNANDPEPFVLAVSEVHSSKWERFYATARDQPILPATSSASAGSEGVHGVEPGETLDGEGHDRAPRPRNTDIAEIPTLVRRLNDLLHGHPDLPPQYEH